MNIIFTRFFARSLVYIGLSKEQFSFYLYLNLSFSNYKCLEKYIYIFYNYLLFPLPNTKSCFSSFHLLIAKKYSIQQIEFLLFDVLLLLLFDILQSPGDISSCIRTYMQNNILYYQTQHRIGTWGSLCLAIMYFCIIPLYIFVLYFILPIPFLVSVKIMVVFLFFFLSVKPG